LSTIAIETPRLVLRTAVTVEVVQAAKYEKRRGVIEQAGFQFDHTARGDHKRCLDGSPIDVHDYRRTRANELR
jgi:hypothetical protein